MDEANVAGGGEASLTVCRSSTGVRASESTAVGETNRASLARDCRASALAARLAVSERRRDRKGRLAECDTVGVCDTVAASPRSTGIDASGIAASCSIAEGDPDSMTVMKVAVYSTMNYVVLFILAAEDSGICRLPSSLSRFRHTFPREDSRCSGLRDQDRVSTP